MKKTNKDKWYKLENAAKIFPPNSNKNDPKTFRFFVELKQEINPDTLQEALDETIKEFPIFQSTLEKGLFWYYLEGSDIKPIVEPETTTPCDELTGELLFRVSYFKKRINVEVHHALTDGTGTLDFLKVLTINYLKIKNKLKLNKKDNDISNYDRAADSYQKYYDKNLKIKKVKEHKAHQIHGKIFPEGKIKTMEVIMPTSQLLKLAKANNQTLTAYLTSILIKSIGDSMSIHERQKPVVITIPVNLRKYFPSNTARNFFNVIPIMYHFNEENDNLESIYPCVKKQFEEQLNKESIQARMNKLAVFEHIFIIRLVPIFIKDFVLKSIYQYTRKSRSMTLSNVGVITMPEDVENFISMFGVCSSTDNIQSCMCSYKDKLTVIFTSHFSNPEIQRNFVKYLTNEGIEVQVNANIVEEDDNASLF